MPGMCSCNCFLQVPMCNEDETKVRMEASAEHADLIVWAHRSVLHNGTVKYDCKNTFIVKMVQIESKNHASIRFCNYLIIQIHKGGDNLRLLL